MLAWITSIHLTSAAIVPISLLPADYNVLESLPGPGVSSVGDRKFNFPVPDGLTSLAPGYAVVGPGYEVSLKSPDAVGLVEFVGAVGTASPLAFITFAPCNGTTANASAIPGISISGGLFIQRAEDLDSELSHRISYYNTNKEEGLQHTYVRSETTLQMKIEGGAFAGKQIALKALVAQGFASIQTDNNWHSIYDIFLAVPWGKDPFQHDLYLFIQFMISVQAGTSDPKCIPLTSSYAKLGSSPDTYVKTVAETITSQLDGPTPSLTGAIPELLFLYDFSGKFTVLPTNTVPADGVELPIASNTFTYTNLNKYINQYDAGDAYQLPKATGETGRGGNACGPTSLGMALNVLNQHQDAVVTYTKTMDGGFTRDGVGNSFAFEPTRIWLTGERAQGNQPAIPGVLPDSIKYDSFWAGDRAVLGSGPETDAGWARIDALLTTTRQPVVLRTDLSAGLSPGGGHMVLLLGKGHSDDIGKLYGLSGDYYVMGDPAGHYFANPSGAHYRTVLNQRVDGKGADYGGWFAVYPVERLRPRISDSKHTHSAVLAMTLGQKFSRLTTVAARPSGGPVHGQARTAGGRVKMDLSVPNPATFVVVDAQGRRTGILPDGTVLAEIPGAGYSPSVADEEGDFGTTTVLPNGSKSVYLLDATPGAYQVQLSATNSGSYALEITTSGADGSVISSTTDYATVAAGDQRTYSLAHPDFNVPRLGVSTDGLSITLTWPASASGYSPQSSTQLNGAVWTKVAGDPKTLNGVNSIQLPLASGPQFFRLSQ